MSDDARTISSQLNEWITRAVERYGPTRVIAALGQAREAIASRSKRGQAREPEPASDEEITALTEVMLDGFVARGASRVEARELMILTLIYSEIADFGHERAASRLELLASKIRSQENEPSSAIN
jgi:hypothetical protein